jgi:hypothetical protein
LTIKTPYAGQLEQTEFSETLAIKLHTPENWNRTEFSETLAIKLHPLENNPKENIRQQWTFITLL